MRVASRTIDLQDTPKPVAAAIGIFDGVHLGHQHLLQLAIREARSRNGTALAITFDRHPNSLLAPHRAPPLLQSLPQRLRSLASTGLDATLVLPFTHQFSQIPAPAFIESAARDLSLAAICIGEGFTFGHQRSGNTLLLQHLAPSLGFLVHTLPPVCLEGIPVRSTRIRELIQQGDLPAANRLLGHPWTLAGTVVHGDHLGRTLGFPTANLDLSGLTLPPTGVYAARAFLNQQPHLAVFNLGLRPTLHHPNPSLRCEVHLLDFHQDLYGLELEIEPVALLRPEQAFPSLDTLQKQIALDIAKARTLLATS